MEFINKQLIAFFVMLLLSVSANAQSSYSYKNLLDTGMIMPDFEVEVANHTASKLRLSDLKGKLVILDFWDVGCAPCIAAMPKMDALQKQFDGKIQIILVTGDSAEKVERFKSSNANFKNNRLLSVVNNTELFSMFPIKTVPSHIWISPEGKVSFITSGYNTTAEKIAAYLRNEHIVLPYEKELKDFDIKQPVWLEGNGRHYDKLQYYSYIYKHIPNTGAQGIHTNPITGLVDRIRASNITILALFRRAFNQYHYGEFTEDNRVILDVEKPELLRFPKDDEAIDLWRKENTYGYELKVSPEQSPYIYDIMKQDLERYFRISGTVEKRVRECWVLTKKENSGNLRTKGGSSISVTNRYIDGEPASIQNSSMAALIRMIEDQLFYLPDDELPVIDQTEISYMIDMKLPNRPEGVAGIQHALQAYGLDLKKEIREINMLVLRDMK